MGWAGRGDQFPRLAWLKPLALAGVHNLLCAPRPISLVEGVGEDASDGIGTPARPTCLRLDASACQTTGYFLRAHTLAAHPDEHLRYPGHLVWVDLDLAAAPPASLIVKLSKTLRHRASVGHPQGLASHAEAGTHSHGSGPHLHPHLGSRALPHLDDLGVGSDGVMSSGHLVSGVERHDVARLRLQADLVLFSEVGPSNGLRQVAG